MGRLKDLAMTRLETVAAEDGGPAQRPLEEWEIIYNDATDHVLDNITSLAPDVAAFSQRAIRFGNKSRLRKLLHNERSHLRKLGQGFRNFDDANVLAESVNYGLTRDFGQWAGQIKDRSDAPSIIGLPDFLGGIPLRSMTFLGMHARACTIASEVSQLARRGFVEGAHGRARSLYELSTLIAFLSIKDTKPPFELTEKYNLSAYIEARKEYAERGDDDPFEEFPELETAIRERWGQTFFKPYGWAASNIGDGTARQVTFRDIECEIGSEHFRHAYLAMNHAVHAGPIAVIRKFDNRKPLPFVTGSDVDYVGCAWVMLAASNFLRRAHACVAASLAPFIDSDLDLTIGVMDKLCDGAEAEFKKFA